MLRKKKKLEKMLEKKCWKKNVWNVWKKMFGKKVFSLEKNMFGKNIQTLIALFQFLLSLTVSCLVLRVLV